MSAVGHAVTVFWIEDCVGVCVVCVCVYVLAAGGERRKTEDVRHRKTALHWRGCSFSPVNPWPPENKPLDEKHIAAN